MIELERLRERFQSIAQGVEQRLTSARWQHTERVAATAVRLAERWGVDLEKAYLAGLLHDVAKDLSKKSLLNATTEFGIVLSALERVTTALIHAPVGAELARTQFHIDDPDILAAIRYHTTGRAGMSPLEKVLFVADYIEPGRSFPGVEVVRTLAVTDLDGAVLRALAQSISHLVEKDRPIAIEAVEARNHMLMDNSG